MKKKIKTKLLNKRFINIILIKTKLIKIFDWVSCGLFYFKKKIISHSRNRSFINSPECFAIFKDQDDHLEGWKIALLKCELDFPSTFRWAANFDLCSLNLRLRISLLSGKSSSNLLQWRALKYPLLSRALRRFKLNNTYLSPSKEIITFSFVVKVISFGLLLDIHYFTIIDRDRRVGNEHERFIDYVTMNWINI